MKLIFRMLGTLLTVELLLNRGLLMGLGLLVLPLLIAIALCGGLLYLGYARKVWPREKPRAQVAEEVRTGKCPGPAYTILMILPAVIVVLGVIQSTQGAVEDWPANFVLALLTFAAAWVLETLVLSIPKLGGTAEIECRRDFVLKPGGFTLKIRRSLAVALCMLAPIYYFGNDWRHLPPLAGQTVPTWMESSSDDTVFAALVHATYQFGTPHAEIVRTLSEQGFQVEGFQVTDHRGSKEKFTATYTRFRLDRVCRWQVIWERRNETADQIEAASGCIGTLYYMYGHFYRGLLWKNENVPEYGSAWGPLLVLIYSE